MDNMKKAVLYIVGSGPGDPELITVKGVKAIERAQVILYDDLASKELLLYAKPNCKLVYVGKRRGKYAFTQDEINQLIVMYGNQYNYILRLKGGDPFVFGRGHEEMDHAMKHGMQVEVVPGISSALSGPAALGIPLTKRGVNESFWVVTGTLSNGDMAGDLQHAARSSATVIVLMGMSRLEKIMETFREARSGSEPVAIVQRATLPEQRSVQGKVDTICEMAREQNIDSPAVIIIGKVVNESLALEAQGIFEASMMRIAV
jgi:uroporphyrin-III C-methyltransferase